MRKSNVTKEFSRFSSSYNTYNIIQEIVAKKLVGMLSLDINTTLVDIGSGTGAVYKYVKEKGMFFEKFIALDYSKEMLDIHPKYKNIQKIYADFNKKETFEFLGSINNSIVVSSSSLQWSKDLDFTLVQLSQKSSKAYFSIFTANTFQTLHQLANIKSPIYTEEEIKEKILKYYNADFNTQVYSLTFRSVREMFRYIKRSGVSGGEKQLSYRQVKQLMKVYPLDYLEFEVLFIEATSLTCCK